MAHDTHAVADHDHGHGNPIPSYLKVFAVLIVFTLLTVGAAAIHMESNQLHVTIGVIIAVIKVVSVMYIFMHLKFDNPLLRFFVYVPVFLFFVLTFALNFLEKWDYTRIAH